MQILQSIGKVGPGFCPETVRKAGRRRCRRPDKCDAGCRPHGRHIPRFAAGGKARSFCRSSSSHRTRFAGLRWEPCVREENSPFSRRCFLSNCPLAVFSPQRCKFGVFSAAGVFSTSPVKAHTTPHSGKQGVTTPLVCSSRGICFSDVTSVTKPSNAVAAMLCGLRSSVTRQ